MNTETAMLACALLGWAAGALTVLAYFWDDISCWRRLRVGQRKEDLLRIVEG